MGSFEFLLSWWLILCSCLCLCAAIVEQHDVDERNSH